MKKCFSLILLLLCTSSGSGIFAQDNTKTSTKLLTWGLLQTLPMPVLIQDRNNNNARVQFGLRWQVIPLNISFRSNKYTSPAQFFLINPVRRYVGSIEFFLQPEWATSSFRYSNLSRFNLGAGSRIIIPLKAEGETFAASIGGKYNLQKDYNDNSSGYWGIEAGLYAIYGILGLQFDYNFKSSTKYSVGFYFKFF